MPDCVAFGRKLVDLARFSCTVKDLAGFDVPKPEPTRSNERDLIRQTHSEDIKTRKATKALHTNIHKIK